MSDLYPYVCMSENNFYTKEDICWSSVVYLLPACREYHEGDMVANSANMFKWRQNAFAECMDP